MTTSRALPVILDPADLAMWMLDNEPDQGWSVEHLLEACAQLGRNAAPAFFISLHDEGALTREHYVALTGEVWSNAEWPLRQLGGDVWLDLFRLAGYTRTMPDDDGGLGRRWPRPRKPVRLYRGADETNRLGWSWSTSLDVARWFAGRPTWPTPGKLWAVTVQPAALLARIDGRGESEYVLDGRDLHPEAVVLWQP